MKRYLMPALAVFTATWPLQCATLERLPLDDMIVKSSSIVRGQVTGSYAAFSGPVIYTHYQIQVSEWLKGSGGGTVEVVAPGGAARGLRQSFSGVPEPSPGEDLVFFLWTGKSGLTQITGLTQGIFSLSKDAAGATLATRAASRELMLEPGTGRPVKDQTLVMSLTELKARVASALAAKGGSR